MAEPREPLSYATPSRTPTWSGDAVLLVRAVRRIAFASGLALILAGIGSSLPAHGADGPMAIGGFLVGLCVPLGRWPRD